MAPADALSQVPARIQFPSIRYLTGYEYIPCRVQTSTAFSLCYQNKRIPSGARSSSAEREQVAKTPPCACLENEKPDTASTTMIPHGLTSKAAPALDAIIRKQSHSVGIAGTPKFRRPELLVRTVSRAANAPHEFSLVGRFCAHHLERHAGGKSKIASHWPISADHGQLWHTMGQVALVLSVAVHVRLPLGRFNSRDVANPDCCQPRCYPLPSAQVLAGKKSCLPDLRVCFSDKMKPPH
ncbi:hypothetical protein CI102_13433 [Trichoderma harzianum]|nr:hypothetical protein CI102_13433 [Trichoderma harzianum]